MRRRLTVTQINYLIESIRAQWRDSETIDLELAEDFVLAKKKHLRSCVSCGSATWVDQKELHPMRCSSCTLVPRGVNTDHSFADRQYHGGNHHD